MKLRSVGRGNGSRRWLCFLLQLEDGIVGCDRGQGGRARWAFASLETLHRRLVFSSFIGLSHLIKRSLFDRRNDVGGDGGSDIARFRISCRLGGSDVEIQRRLMTRTAARGFGRWKVVDEVGGGRRK